MGLINTSSKYGYPVQRLHGVCWVSLQHRHAVRAQEGEKCSQPVVNALLLAPASRSYCLTLQVCIEPSMNSVQHVSSTLLTGHHVSENGLWSTARTHRYNTPIRAAMSTVVRKVRLYWTTAGCTLCCSAYTCFQCMIR
jgi:hypothetical protein